VKKSLLIVFLLLVIAPLAVITWLSYSNIVREETMTKERFALLGKRQLEEVDRLLQSYLKKLELELGEYENIHALDTNELRRITRNTRIVGQLFVIDDEGAFVFPPESGEISAQERAFLESAGDLELPLVLGSNAVESAKGDSEERGWYTWFMGEGINFLYWQTGDNGYRTGVVLERIALISSIIALLPDSDFTATDEKLSRVVMTDARGNVLYQWGLYSPVEDEQPLAMSGLSRPLASWRLQIYLDTGAGLPFLKRFGALLPGVAAVMIVLILLSIYFYRENRKVVTEALHKVSFVNQVSHELRTPLTNIRLYAELLKERLSDGKDVSQLEIVLSESRRLSRMITNVLTFSRSEKKGFDANPVETVIDEVIQRVMESFAVSLKSKGIEVVLSCSAPGCIVTDGDFVEQILSNLIGNVEKYAAAGGYLEIGSSQNDESTMVRVKDKGPGIPAKERQSVFEPFYRISNRLTDGVSGAGIGLAVSRMLAEKIGGSLTLDKEGPGAVFTLEIVHDIAGESV
jgi:signal transduction histidine kinase